MKIIYINDHGGVSVIHPTEEALELYGIGAIAAKDVPAGKPFKLIADEELPSREDREAWTVDPSELTDGVGGQSPQFEV
jgi:hypothetical protein